MNRRGQHIHDKQRRDLKRPPRLRQQKRHLQLKINTRYVNYFAIIPTRSACITWQKYPGTELIGTTLKLRKRAKDLQLCSYVVHKPLNLVVFGFWFAEDGQTNVQNFYRTRRVAVCLLHSVF